MIRYETLMLAHPDVSEEVLAAIEKQFDLVSAKYKGKMISFDKWGKYRLSYPVKKHEFGSYVLVRFELGKENTAEALEELRQFFQIRCGDTILRYLNKNLDLETSLEYTKPESIVPTERQGRGMHGDDGHFRSRDGSYDRHEDRNDLGHDMEN